MRALRRRRQEAFSRLHRRASKKWRAIPSPTIRTRSAKAMASISPMRGKGLRLVGSGIACLIHAVFPFLFVHTASDTVKDMHRGIAKPTDGPNWERHPII